MIKRDVSSRYQGSVMGLVWSFINPLLMLTIYTFVFSVVFKARWGVSIGVDKIDYAIILFVGLVMHGILGECLSLAPSLIVSNLNYVKKVIFPLEILPLVSLGTALFHAAVSIGVLLIVQLIFNQYIPVTAILFPIIFLPLIFGTLGLAWFISSLGVYLRDIGHLTNMFITVMLFVSAIFFPMSALPERYQICFHLNPLAVIIEEGRKALIFGQLPNFTVWLVLMTLGLFVAWCGFAWFQKTRKGFADVL